MGGGRERGGGGGGREKACVVDFTKLRLPPGDTEMLSHRHTHIFLSDGNLTNSSWQHTSIGLAAWRRFALCLLQRLRERLLFTTEISPASPSLLQSELRPPSLRQNPGHEHFIPQVWIPENSLLPQNAIITFLNRIHVDKCTKGHFYSYLFLRITIHLLLHKCNFCIFIFGRTFTLRRQPQDGFEFPKLLHYKVFIISHPSLQYLENSIFYFLSLFYVTRFTIVISKGSSFLILQVVPYIFFFNIPFDLDINFLNMH